MWVAALRNMATRLRIDVINATSAGGRGHPTSCCSAAELIAALFFAEMRFDPQHPADSDVYSGPSVLCGVAHGDRIGSSIARAADEELGRVVDGLNEIIG
jgi:hypothetical protein